MAAALGLSLALMSCANVDDSVVDAAVDPAVKVTQGLVLLNATVVNTRDGSLSSGRAVVIEGGWIRRIVASSAVRPSGTAQVIDARGKYVVPGYLDMHSHALDSADRQPSNWPLMIANGITGVREAGGVPNAIARSRQLNAERAAGSLSAPEILLTPGDTLADMTSAAAAVAAVQQRKAQGAGFVKVVSANRPAMLAILSEAKAQGLDVAGHLTPALSALESSNAGLKSIEHLGSSMGTLLDCSTDEDAIRAALLAGPGGKPGAAQIAPPAVPSFAANAANAALFQRVLDTYSEAKCQALAQAFVRNGTWHVPTLRRVRTLLTSDDPALASAADLAYADPLLRAGWDKAAQLFRSTLDVNARATFRRYYQQQQALTRLLKQAGVKMLTGSDISRISIWLVPGFSLQQDFSELAAAGLSPLEILQMTTLNAAEFLHREATLGTVEAGKQADLVLLDANPLADAANLGRIAAVVLQGRYLPKEQLEQMKRGVTQAYKIQAQAALPSEALARRSEALDPIRYLSCEHELPAGQAVQDTALNRAHRHSTL